MKKYIVIVIAFATILVTNAANAQTVSARHKAKKHKATHHVAAHHVAAHHVAAHHVAAHHVAAHHVAAHHVVHKVVAHKHSHLHHGKAIAHHHHHHHHTVMHHAAIQSNIIAVAAPASSATVEVKNGLVYVNDSLVFKIKSLKHEDDKITLNYVTPPPAVVLPQQTTGDNGNAGDEANESKKAELGVFTHDYMHEGAMVEDVRPCSPADKAGLDRGDVIMGVNGHEIHGADDLADAIGGYHPGDSISIDFMHFGSMRSTNAWLRAKEEMKDHNCCEMHDEQEHCFWFGRGRW